jgi:hypothetical protein
VDFRHCFCRVFFFSLDFQLLGNFLDQHLLFLVTLLLALHFLMFNRCLWVRVCDVTWVFKALTHFYLCSCRGFLLYPHQVEQLCLQGSDIFQLYDILGLHHPFLSSLALSSNPNIFP